MPPCDILASPADGGGGFGWWQLGGAPKHGDRSAAAPVVVTSAVSFVSVTATAVGVHGNPEEAAHGRARGRGDAGLGGGRLRHRRWRRRRRRGGGRSGSRVESEPTARGGGGQLQRTRPCTPGTRDSAVRKNPINPKYSLCQPTGENAQGWWLTRQSCIPRQPRRQGWCWQGRANTSPRVAHRRSVSACPSGEHCACTSAFTSARRRRCN